MSAVPKSLDTRLRTLDASDWTATIDRVGKRWFAFNAVGIIGMLVQLAVVGVLVRLAGWHYLVATAVAVEAAVLHNFIWHQRWTWRDRPAQSPRTTTIRLARFHLLNGAVSLAGNIGLTAFFTGVIGLNAIVSNLIAIIACSLVNFAASDSIVFKSDRPRRWRSVVVAMFVVLSLTASAEAGPTAATLAGWRAYEAQVDARYNAPASTSAGFFALDREAHERGWRDGVRRGQPILVKIDPPGVEDGKIHHWIGAVFIPGLTVQSVIDRIQQNAGHESEHYADVLASRLIQRSGDHLKVFMKLRRTNLITVTYNTEHAVDYKRIGDSRATARSVATKIAELADVGTSTEHEKSADDDNGFLWRLNAYWRYEAVDGGVIVECESVSLSRSVPWVARLVANPLVDRVARESLSRTLSGLRAMLTGQPAAKAS